MGFKSYGLHPSLWRKIRLHHSGNAEISIKNRDGEVLGVGIVSRYNNIIYLSSEINFRDMSIKRLMVDTKNVFILNLKGNKVPLCFNHYG